MSLKSFHIVFIVASIVLSFLVGAWGLQQYRVEGESSGLWLAILFNATGVVLVVYAMRFVRKTKDLGI